jgi:hypothetical protein
MSITLTTPAILFSTVSLVHIGYTNRFVSLSHLVRGLKERYINTQDEAIIQQISNLRRRIVLIRNMQFLGLISLFLSICSILFLYADYEWLGGFVFVVSLFFLMVSVVMASIEIWISMDALHIELRSIEKMNEELNESSMIEHGIKKITKMFVNQNPEDKT